MQDEPDISVDGKLRGDGVVVLSLNFEADILFNERRKRITDELMKEYNRVRDPSIPKPSCIVEMKTDVAGSPVIRALFDLWKLVQQNPRAKLVCVNFPEDYEESLVAIAMHEVDSFSLAPNLDVATDIINAVPPASTS